MYATVNVNHNFPSFIVITRRDDDNFVFQSDKFLIMSFFSKLLIVCLKF